MCVTLVSLSRRRFQSFIGDQRYNDEVRTVWRTNLNVTLVPRLHLLPNNPVLTE